MEIRQAEFLQLFLDISGLNPGFSDLPGELRHGFIAPAGLLGLFIPLAPGLAGGFAGKAIRSGKFQIIQLCLGVFHDLSQAPWIDWFAHGPIVARQKPDFFPAFSQSR